MKRAGLVFLVACTAEQATDLPVENKLEQAATVCGSGAEVKGIDVSYYQGNIDWTKVAADGVKYAFIRVSDGLNYPDSKFATYWPQAKANGILRGAYQFFRPAQDPIEQANLLLQRIGTQEPGDLPPVIDVEADGGLAPETVAAKVKQWIDHVEAATGVKPIIYTGFYFWRDEVGAPAFGADYPLWHAQYTTADCPNIPPPWTSWAFWQFTDSGRVNGIAGPVDTNRFNGTYTDLAALTGPAAPCGTLPGEGGMIDDGDVCFTSGGPPASLRNVTDAGEGGDLVWTHATDGNEANFARWTIDLAEAGRYRVEVYTAGAYAESTKARYIVSANGREHEVMLDQSAADGWQTLATLDFAAGGSQWIHLGDSTGEPVADKVQLVFDAIRLTRIDPNTDPTEFPGEEESKADGGCNAGGASGSAMGLALLGFVGRRRRLRSGPRTERLASSGSHDPTHVRGP
ncbi:MAG: GH25 family lysozyme [Kofleriaceae bacterium]|nr:GH25 family lysozyme [Kofleriaceae bacterium]